MRIGLKGVNASKLGNAIGQPLGFHDLCLSPVIARSVRFEIVSNVNTITRMYFRVQQKGL